jgi:multidrug resistance efflux pump
MNASPASSGSSVQRYLFIALAVLGVLKVVGGGWYLAESGRYVYSDKAAVEAPVIQLAPSAPGTLMSVLVHDGDSVRASQSVARVGGEMLSARVAGRVLVAKRDIGAAYLPGQPVVTMIQPSQLRIVARIEENKGLKDVRPGQEAIFTVDAFGSQQFEGTVESVAATNVEGDVVFNISDKREAKEFEVKIAYDQDAAPRFENGMSARVWIVK